MVTTWNSLSSHQKTKITRIKLESFIKEPVKKEKKRQLKKAKTARNVLYEILKRVGWREHKIYRVGQESNQGQLLGRQLCSPLYHRRFGLLFLLYEMFCCHKRPSITLEKARLITDRSQLTNRCQYVQVSLIESSPVSWLKAFVLLGVSRLNNILRPVVQMQGPDCLRFLQVTKSIRNFVWKAASRNRSSFIIIFKML